MSVDPLDALAMPPRRYARAHRDDPSSSHDAARGITDSGAADAQMQHVFAAVRLYPGSTSAELAQSSKIELYVVRRRLSDLLAANQVRRADPNMHTIACRMSGKRVCRWYPL